MRYWSIHFLHEPAGFVMSRVFIYFSGLRVVDAAGQLSSL